MAKYLKRFPPLFSRLFFHHLTRTKKEETPQGQPVSFPPLAATPEVPQPSSAEDQVGLSSEACEVLLKTHFS